MTQATAKPTCRLRWVPLSMMQAHRHKLQQAWEIVHYDGAQPTRMEVEWRDIPFVDAVDGAVHGEIVHNVHDRRRGWIGGWETAPLDYDQLGPEHIGKTVIYRDHGRAEAGTLSSWRDRIVFARYSRGDTAAGANASDLVFGVRHLDGPPVTGAE